VSIMIGRARGTLLVLAVMGLLLPAAPALAASTDAPVVGQCTNDPTMESWAHSGVVVDCAGPHTGQTVWVGPWTAATSPTQADVNATGSAADVALRAEFQSSFDACEAAMTSLIGGVRQGYQIFNQFTTNFVGPNDAEWADGQRWARCDVIASAPLTRKDVWSLKQLPAPAALAGIMETPLKTNPFRFCFWDKKASSGLIDCASPYVTYELPVTYAGTDLTWTGSARSLLLKVRAMCRSNPTVRSFGAKVRDIHVSQTEKVRLTKKNFRDQTYYCMIEQ
jgi:hypothetical protein